MESILLMSLIPSFSTPSFHAWGMKEMSTGKNKNKKTEWQASVKTIHPQLYLCKEALAWWQKCTYNIHDIDLRSFTDGFYVQASDWLAYNCLGHQLSNTDKDKKDTNKSKKCESANTQRELTNHAIKQCCSCTCKTYWWKTSSLSNWQWFGQ